MALKDERQRQSRDNKSDLLVTKDCQQQSHMEE
jgi:hypothetical protein